MSEIKNGRLGLYDAEHSKCDCMMTLGFKGLNFERWSEVSLVFILQHSVSVVCAAARLLSFVFCC